MIRFVPHLVFLASFTAKAQAPPPKPKLVVAIIVD
jgi:hypothetical protein